MNFLKPVFLAAGLAVSSVAVTVTALPAHAQVLTQAEVLALVQQAIVDVTAEIATLDPNDPTDAALINDLQADLDTLQVYEDVVVLLSDGAALLDPIVDFIDSISAS